MTFVYACCIVAWILSVLGNFLPNDKQEIKNDISNMAIAWLAVAIFIFANKVK